MTSRVVQRVVAALLLAGCGAVATTAARGSSWASPDWTSAGSQRPVAILAAVVGAAGIGAVVTRGLWRAGAAPALFMTVPAVAVLAGAAVLLLVVEGNHSKGVATGGWCIRAYDPAVCGHAGDGVRIPGGRRRKPDGGSVGSSAWLWVVGLGGAVASATGIFVLARRSRARVAEPDHPDAARALAFAIDESLDDLRREPDARRAVIACYARMERALARAGVARRPSETPLEFLARVLLELCVPAGSVQVVTALFEEAKFSTHPVGEKMRTAAIAALENLQRDLARTAAGAGIALGGSPVTAV